VRREESVGAIISGATRGTLLMGPIIGEVRRGDSTQDGRASEQYAARSAPFVRFSRPSARDGRRDPARRPAASAVPPSRPRSPVCGGVPAASPGHLHDECPRSHSGGPHKNGAPPTEKVRCGKSYQGHGFHRRKPMPALKPSRSFFVIDLGYHDNGRNGTIRNAPTRWHQPTAHGTVRARSGFPQQRANEKHNDQPRNCEDE